MKTVMENKYGEPIQIVKFNKEQKLELNILALEAILLNDKIRNTNVRIISVVGDVRKGKSFLLNFILRYFISICSNINNDWLDNSPFECQGFSSEGGSDKITNGILMWSQPFIIKENGESFAIILMDTEGIFDSEHTIAQASKIFALSTMLSSLQIYNIMHNLQEDNIQNMAVFTEYGLLVLEEKCESPFQKLIFLIRDWSFPYEHQYGYNGGQNLLTKKLRVKEDQHYEFASVRNLIQKCFEEIYCYLMPYPGDKVAKNRYFTGLISDVDPEFIDCINNFIPSIVEKSKSKLVDRKENTGLHLCKYFEKYVELMQGDKIPPPMSWLEATSTIDNQVALSGAKVLYQASMEFIIAGKSFSRESFLEEHVTISNKAISFFENAKKRRDDESSEHYRQLLIQFMQDKFNGYAEINHLNHLVFLESNVNKYRNVYNGAVGAIGALATFGGAIGSITTIETIGAIGTMTRIAAVGAIGVTGTLGFIVVGVVATELLKKYLKNKTE